MNRIAACILAVLSLTASLAQAQTNAAPAIAPLPSVDSLPPEKVALARNLMTASGGSEQVATLMRTIFQGVNGMMAKTVPPEQARIVAIFQGQLQDGMVALAPALTEIGVRVYASGLSETELRDYLAFERSPTGQAIRAKSPSLARQMVSAEAPLVMSMMPALLQRAMDQACVAAKCTEQDRAVVTAALQKAMSKWAG